MPEWGWIIIFAVGTPALLAIIWRLLATGGRLAFGKSSIVIHGEERRNTDPLGDALKFVPSNIGIVHNYLYGLYLKAVKAKGIDPGVMTEIEDSRFARAVLRNAVCLGNGSRSVQKIIESAIASADFRDRDIGHYVRGTIVPRAIDAVQTIINSEYDSIASYAEYSTRARIISQAEFVDIVRSEAAKDGLATVIMPFFVHANDCVGGGCSE